LTAVRHLVAGEVEIGNAPRLGQLIVGGYPSARLAPDGARVAADIASDLRAANWLSQDVPSIADWLAWKLLVSATFPGAVLNGSAEDKASLQEQLAAEARAALTAAGHTIADPASLSYDRREAAVSAEAYGAHQNSTWQSFARGSGSEVDYLSGEIVLLARAYGTAAPVAAALQRVLGLSAAAGEGPGIHHVSEVFAAASGRTPEGVLP
jgi:2-dehydropantoate 2-reductase